MKDMFMYRLWKGRSLRCQRQSCNFNFSDMFRTKDLTLHFGFLVTWKAAIFLLLISRGIRMNIYNFYNVSNNRNKLVSRALRNIMYNYKLLKSVMCHYLIHFKIVISKSLWYWRNTNLWEMLLQKSKCLLFA